MQDAVAGTAMLTDGFEDEIDSVTPRSPVAGMGVGATPGGVGLGSIGIGVGGKKVRLYGEPGGPAAERLDFKLAAAAVLSSGPGSGSEEDEVSEVATLKASLAKQRARERPLKLRSITQHCGEIVPLLSSKAYIQFDDGHVW